MGAPTTGGPSEPATSHRLEQEAAIRKLLAQYCHAYDDGRAADFGALFTEKAELHVLGRTHRGRDAIEADIGNRRPDTPPGQHVTYNSVIEIDADGTRARAWTDFLYLKCAEGGYVISTAGRYHDRLVREPDRWRFQRRTIVFLGDPVPDDA